MSTASDGTLLSSKRAIYVGGIAKKVTPQLLRAAMIPFGNIKSLDMPMDYKEGVHRGFGFVEFDDADDAAEAIFNMDGAELMGRTIRVSLAQQNQLSKISGGGGSSQAIWSSDAWFQQHVGGDLSPEEQAQQAQQQSDQTSLRNS